MRPAIAENRKRVSPHDERSYPDRLPACLPASSFATHVLFDNPLQSQLLDTTTTMKKKQGAPVSSGAPRSERTTVDRCTMIVPATRWYFGTDPGQHAGGRVHHPGSIGIAFGEHDR